MTELHGRDVVSVGEARGLSRGDGRDVGSASAGGSGKHAMAAARAASILSFVVFGCTKGLRTVGAHSFRPNGPGFFSPRQRLGSQVIYMDAV